MVGSATDRMDDSWNRDGFKALAKLARILRDDPRLEPLAEYCDLRIRGLRRPALHAVERFLSGAEGWDAATQRSVALRVLELHWSNPMAHQFLSHPVQHRFVEPVLDAWRREEPDSATPLMQLGMLRDDTSLLREALHRDQTNQTVRWAIAGNLLRAVWYATHHLAEGVLLADEQLIESFLDEAESLSTLDADSPMEAHCRREIEMYRRQLADWREYQAAPEGSFPDWCRAHGRDYAWVGTVYYRD